MPRCRDAHRHEEHQDDELDHHHDPFGAGHRRRCRDVQQRDEDYCGTQKQVFRAGSDPVGQQARRRAAERLVDEGDRAAFAWVRLLQQRIGPCRQQSHAAGHEERDRRTATGDLHGQPEHRGDPPTDHPTDADGYDAPEPDLTRRGTLLRYAARVPAYWLGVPEDVRPLGLRPSCDPPADRACWVGGTVAWPGKIK